MYAMLSLAPFLEDCQVWGPIFSIVSKGFLGNVPYILNLAWLIDQQKCFVFQEFEKYTMYVDIERHYQKGPVQSELSNRHLLAYMFDQLSGGQAAKDGNLFISSSLFRLIWHLPNIVLKALCMSVHCMWHAVCIAKPKMIGPQWLKDWSSHLWVHVISSREHGADICYSLGSGGGLIFIKQQAYSEHCLIEFHFRIYFVLWCGFRISFQFQNKIFAQITEWIEREA